MTTEARYYGVSSGDGNNGVSQMFPDYIVKTSEPWRLAELAGLTQFKPGDGHTWAKENMEIEGEADCTIYVIFSESPEQQEEFAEIDHEITRLRDAADAELNDKQARKLDEQADELQSQLDNWDSTAWLIIEVFPWEGELKRPNYESLDECFGEDVKLVAA